jgi:hypothetical protein
MPEAQKASAQNKLHTFVALRVQGCVLIDAQISRTWMFWGSKPVRNTKKLHTSVALVPQGCVLEMPKTANHGKVGADGQRLPGVEAIIP